MSRLSDRRSVWLGRRALSNDGLTSWASVSGVAIVSTSHVLEPVRLNTARGWTA